MAESLRAVVRVVLTSRLRCGWPGAGADVSLQRRLLPTVGINGLGDRQPVGQVWAEIWPDIGPRIAHVLGSGEATWDEALLLYLERSGFAEETYHTFSYSLWTDDAGVTSGMLCVVAESRAGDRRTPAAHLRDVGSALATASTRAEVMTSLETCLNVGTRDVPFALIYLATEPAGRSWARCMIRTAYSVDFTAGRSQGPAAWQLAQAASGGLFWSISIRFPMQAFPRSGQASIGFGNYRHRRRR